MLYDLIVTAIFVTCFRLGRWIMEKLDSFRWMCSGEIC